MGGACGAPAGPLREAVAHVAALTAAADPLTALQARAQLLGRTVVADLVGVSDANRSRRDARWSTLLALRAAGQAPGPWMAWAGHLGDLVALTALIDEVLGAAPSPAALQAWAAALEGSPAAQAAFLRAVAGRLDAPVRRLELQAALGGYDDIDGLRAAVAALLAHLDPPPQANRAWTALRAKLTARHAAARSGARFAHLLTRPLPAFGAAAVADAIEKTVAFLDEDPLHADSHEVQRWGLAGDPTPRRGQWYVRAFIAEALWEAGFPDPAAVARLFAEIPPEGPRYFGPWAALPPDADSLGLFLQLAARLPEAPRAAVEGWLGPFWATRTQSGGSSTWLPVGPAGPLCPAPAWTWGGDDCVAVQIIALLGLLAWGEPQAPALAAAALPAILDLHRPGACFYYGAAMGDLLLVRLAAALAHHGAPLPALTLFAGARVAAIQATQAVDGGWGSPQETALRLEALCRGGGQPLAIWRAARYLCDHQRPDGSFGVEGLFLTLGKPPFPTHWHGGPALTAAVVLRALTAARPLLETA